MSARSTVTVLGAVTVLLVAGAFVALPALAQDGGNGDDEVVTPTPSNDGDLPDPYDCSDFENVDQLREVYDPANDTSDLDSDNEPEDPDKIACESMFPDQESYEDTEIPTPTPAPDDEMKDDKKEEQKDKKKEDMKDEKKEEEKGDEMKEEKKDDKKDDKKEDMKDEKMDDTEEEQPPC
jgi:type IV secretory pathway VirB10-like protein